jgi:flagellar biosynthesis GTPase FlhF
MSAKVTKPKSEELVSGALPAISKIVLKYDQDGKTHLFIQKWKESLEHSFGKAQHLLDYQHIPRYGSHKVFTIPDPAAEHIRLHKKKTAWQDHKKEIDAKAKSVPKRVSKTPAEKPASRSSKRVARSKAAAKEEEDEEDNEENEASETEQADPPNTHQTTLKKLPHKTHNTITSQINRVLTLISSKQSTRSSYRN